MEGTRFDLNTPNNSSSTFDFAGTCGIVGGVIGYILLGLGIVTIYFGIFGIIGIFMGVSFKLTIMLAMWVMTLGWGDIILWSTVGGFCIGVLLCP